MLKAFALTNDFVLDFLVTQYVIIPLNACQILCLILLHSQDQAKLQADIEKKNNAYRGLKKEYQKSKKLIAEYQLMLRAGASGFHKVNYFMLHHQASMENDVFIRQL